MRLSRLVLVLMSITSTAMAQTCGVVEFFQGLGDLPGGAYSSAAWGLSGDGSTVVGGSVSSNSSPNTEAFRWTAAGGIAGLGDLAGGPVHSFANGASYDGQVVVGTGSVGSTNQTGSAMAFLWSAAAGVVSLGDLPGGWYYSTGQTINDAGTLVAGGTFSGSYRASVWSAQTGWLIVESSGWPASAVRRLSRNGAWGACTRGFANQPSEAFIVDLGGSGLISAIGILPGGSAAAEARAISNDGTVAVGFSQSATGWEAFRWTPAGGIVGLGDLPSGTFESLAYGMTPDGATAVGYGTSSIGKEAVTWDATGLLQRVADVLTNAGVSVPTGWTLTEAVDVVSDGYSVTICGNGVNPTGQPEAWIARYVPPTSGLLYPGSAEGFTLTTGVGGAFCTTGPGQDLKTMTAGGLLSVCLSTTCPSLYGAPVILAGQVLPSGTPLLPSIVPGLWLDPAALIVVVDGTVPGPFGASHVLVPGGLSFGFQVPFFFSSLEVALQGAALSPAAALGFALSEAHMVVVQ